MQGIIERACEIARSGQFETFDQVQKALKREGFSAGQIEQHLFGKGIRTQIKSACREAVLAKV